MKTLFRVAIDGPGGAGKSTIAKRVAKILNIIYIDTGAMYRAAAYKIKKEIPHISELDLNLINDSEEYKQIKEIIEKMDIDFKDGLIRVDGEIVEDKIRTPEISMLASGISKLPIVRIYLGDIQKKIASDNNVVMDGRDIGTNIIKDAELKIYLTASLKVRAKRRYDELKEKGKIENFNEILEDIRKRDFQDQARELNPLKKAEDAIELDTTNMNIEEVVNFIIREAEKIKRNKIN
ncbi:(d)CMP kinase [Alterileibacterium massiliense]|uniref:(d)CMP kinase n=1 Tax=Alterileibacterium massiliense TaxID=1870997 RepID=UPI000A830978|nr:(d)CMP kinase [Alterileibacterium massiliense]